MKNDPKLIECLFGHHQYSKELTKDRDDRSIRLCQVCKRKALWCWYDYAGTAGFVEYDEKGNATHITHSSGFELARNKGGKWAVAKRSVDV